MENTVTKFRWFWAWQDEAEAAWLAEKSKQGLHLVFPGVFGFYRFTQGEPHDYVYRLDFRAFGKEDLIKYIEIGRKAGWEYLGQFGGWQYFRKDARSVGEKERKADKTARISLYRRITVYLAICFLFLAMLALVFFERPGIDPAASAVIWILAVLLVLVAGVIIRLALQIWRTGKQ